LSASDLLVCMLSSRSTFHMGITAIPITPASFKTWVMGSEWNTVYMISIECQLKLMSWR